MGLGILEYRGTLEHVPGTVQLEDVVPANTAHLKKASTDKGDVVLVPQPSNSPNDPLNWPTWQKDLLLLVFLYCNVIVIAGIGPLLTVMALPLILEFKVTFTQVSLLTGYQLCVVGAVAAPVSALAHKYGKRPGFIVSIFLSLIGSIVCATAQSYNALLAGRLIQGLGVAQFESVGYSLIGDLYFVHERGSRMAIFITSQVAMINIPGIIAGVITLHLSWRWAIRILCIFLGFACLLIVVFGWETSYNRNEIYNIDTSSHDNIQIIEASKSGRTDVETVEMEHLEHTLTQSSAKQTRNSLAQRLKPWSTTYTKEPLTTLVLRPFIVLANPVILWAAIFIALNQVWSVMVALVNAQLFAPPPYGLNSAQLGYLGVGPTVGALLICLLYGVTSDRLVRTMAKRNSGVFEPEFRLVFLLITPIFSTIGWFLFGNMAAQQKSPTIISVAWGIAFVSTLILANALSNYLVDAYREVSVEIFIASMAMKNFVFFGFSYFINDWVVTWGPAKTFDVIGGIMLAYTITAIPFYIFGKRLRAWWHLHDLSRKF